MITHLEKILLCFIPEKLDCRYAMKKNGMAIPLVLIFCVISFIFLYSLFSSRIAVRKQTMSTHFQKRAYYLALGGIQHALLKLRLLHRKAYDASAMAKGICPFLNPYGDNLARAKGTQSNKALNIILSDLKSSSTDPNLDLVLKAGDYPIPTHSTYRWRYEVASFSVDSYYQEPDGSVKVVAFVRAIGYTYDPRDINERGQAEERKEVVEKIVDIKRKIRN